MNPCPSIVPKCGPTSKEKKLYLDVAALLAVGTVAAQLVFDDVAAHFSISATGILVNANVLRRFLQAALA
jgi:hypothetical protein